MQRVVQGLGGWFSNIAKKIAGAIGAAIGGPIGYAIGKTTAWAVDRYVFGNKSASLKLFGFGLAGAGLGLPQKLTVRPLPDNKGGIDENMTDKERKEIEDWMIKTVKPWIVSVAGRINGSASITELKSAAFRGKVNEVLMTLYYAEMFYRVQASQGLSGSVFDFEEIEVDQKNKSTIILSYITGIKEAIIQYWKSKGIEPKVKKINLSDEYSPISTPETMVFERKTTTTIEVFVDPKMEVGDKPTSVTDREIVLIKGKLKTTKRLSKVQFDNKSEDDKHQAVVEYPESPLSDTEPDALEESIYKTETPSPPVQNSGNKEISKTVFPKWLWPSIGATVVSVMMSKILK